MPTSRRESRETRRDVEQRPGAYPGLAALLWTVRESLEAVLYTLAVVRLVVTDGSPRWLPRADAELHQALDALRAAEVMRAAEVDAVAGPGGERSLEALVRLAPEPWPAVFAEHREALRLLLSEVDAAVAANRGVLQAAARRTRVPATCSSPSRRESAAVATAAAYRSALVSLDTVPQLSLHDFLA